jgi:hypothetical protein
LAARAERIDILARSTLSGTDMVTIPVRADACIVRDWTRFTETERTDRAAPGTNTCSSIVAKLPVLGFLPADFYRTTMNVLLGIMVERLIS